MALPNPELGSAFFCRSVRSTTGGALPLPLRSGFGGTAFHRFHSAADKRIRSHATSLGITLKTEVFESREAWQNYAISALKTVESIATDLGIAEHLHLWPDKSLGTSGFLHRCPDSQRHREWLSRSWTRISEWPILTTS